MIQKPTFTRPPQQGGSWNSNPSVTMPHEYNTQPQTPNQLIGQSSHIPGMMNPYFTPNSQMSRTPGQVTPLPEWKEQEEIDAFLKSLPNLAKNLSYLLHRKKRNAVTQTQHGVIRYDHRGLSIVDKAVAAQMQEERPHMFCIRVGSSDAMGAGTELEGLLSDTSLHKDLEHAENTLKMQRGEVPQIPVKENPDFIQLKEKYEALKAKEDKHTIELNAAREENLKLKEKMKNYEAFAEILDKVDDEKAKVYAEFTEAYLKGNTPEALRLVWNAEKLGSLPRALYTKEEKGSKSKS